MNVLVVVAHPEPKSFNGALRDTAVAALTDDGHRVEVSALYAAGFRAVAGADDFSTRADADYLRIDREQTAAHGSGGTRSSRSARSTRSRSRTVRPRRSSPASCRR